MTRALCFFVIAALSLTGAAAQDKPTLVGSKEAVMHAHAVALEHDLTFVRDAAEVKKFANLKLLVPVVDTEYLELHEVGPPFARPELKLLVERLSEQFYKYCHERLVLTSLVRTLDNQPWNASQYSVHPAGIAADFRPPQGPCRAWLEQNLLKLEARGVADATKEAHPAHYHVVVYPRPYTQYLKARGVALK